MTPAEENPTATTAQQNPLPTFFGVFMACFVFIVISIAFGFHLLTIPLAIACGITFKKAVGKRITESYWVSLSTEEHNIKHGHWESLSTEEHHIKHSHWESLSTEEHNIKFGHHESAFITEDRWPPIPTTSSHHPFLNEYNRNSNLSIYYDPYRYDQSNSYITQHHSDPFLTQQ